MNEKPQILFTPLLTFYSPSFETLIEKALILQSVDKARGKYLSKTNKSELLNHLFYWGLLYIFEVRSCIFRVQLKNWGQNIKIKSWTSFDLNDLKRPWWEQWEQFQKELTYEMNGRMKLLWGEYAAHAWADLAVGLLPDKFSDHYKVEWVLELVYHVLLSIPGQIWTESL
jgi:hypothetical protein